MDWLTRDPPSKVNVCGVPVPIRTGWKRAVCSLVLQGDRDRIPLVDADEMLGSWFSRDGVIPPEVLGHWYEALTAALGWRDTAMRTALPYGERDAGQPRARVFDWEADSGIVVVDFRRIYGIDLATAQMHWWRFALLFDGICATPGSLVSTAMRTFEHRTFPSSATSGFYRDVWTVPAGDHSVYATIVPGVANFHTYGTGDANGWAGQRLMVYRLKSGGKEIPEGTIGSPDAPWMSRYLEAHGDGSSELPAFTSDHK